MGRKTKKIDSEEIYLPTYTPKIEMDLLKFMMELNI